MQKEQSTLNSFLVRFLGSSFTSNRASHHTPLTVAASQLLLNTIARVGLVSLTPIPVLTTPNTLISSSNGPRGQRHWPRGHY